MIIVRPLILQSVHLGVVRVLLGRMIYLHILIRVVHILSHLLVLLVENWS